MLREAIAEIVRLYYFNIKEFDGSYSLFLHKFILLDRQKLVFDLMLRLTF
jgi:hypothetical protein